MPSSYISSCLRFIQWVGALPPFPAVQVTSEYKLSVKWRRRDEASGDPDPLPDLNRPTWGSEPYMSDLLLRSPAVLLLKGDRLTFEAFVAHLENNGDKKARNPLLTEFLLDCRDALDEFQPQLHELKGPEGTMAGRLFGMVRSAIVEEAQPRLEEWRDRARVYSYVRSGKAPKAIVKRLQAAMIKVHLVTQIPRCEAETAITLALTEPAVVEAFFQGVRFLVGEGPPAPPSKG